MGRLPREGKAEEVDGRPRRVERRTWKDALRPVRMLRPTGEGKNRRIVEGLENREDETGGIPHPRLFLAKSAESHEKAAYPALCKYSL